MDAIYYSKPAMNFILYSKIKVDSFIVSHKQYYSRKPLMLHQNLYNQQ